MTWSAYLKPLTSWLSPVSNFFSAESRLFTGIGYSMRFSLLALQSGQQSMSRRKMAVGCCLHRPLTRPSQVAPHF